MNGAALGTREISQSSTQAYEQRVFNGMSMEAKKIK